MGIVSEFFRTPFVAPRLTGFSDGLVEPGVDFDPSLVALPPVEGIHGHSIPYEGVYGHPMTYGSDAFDTHDPNADPLSIGRDMDAEAYVDEAQRLVGEFSGDNETQTLEEAIQGRIFELRAALRARPWFRIICDAKLMVDESRNAWADRRHRAFVALGFRKTNQPCQHCFQQNGVNEQPVNGRYVNGHFAAPSMGDFTAPSDNGSSEIADAIRSVGYQVSHASYDMGRAVRAMEQAVAARSHDHQHAGVHHGVQYQHRTTGVLQHVPPTPFPVYQQPFPVYQAPPDAPTNDGLADFVPEEPASLGAAVPLFAGEGGATGDGGEVVVIGGGQTPPVETTVAETPVDAPLSQASPHASAVEKLRAEIAETIQKLSATLEELKRPS